MAGTVKNKKPLLRLRLKGLIVAMPGVVDGDADQTSSQHQQCSILGMTTGSSKEPTTCSGWLTRMIMACHNIHCLKLHTCCYSNYSTCTILNNVTVNCPQIWIILLWSSVVHYSACYSAFIARSTFIPTIVFFFLEFLIFYWVYFLSTFFCKYNGTSINGHLSWAGTSA